MIARGDFNYHGLYAPFDQGLSLVKTNLRQLINNVCMNVYKTYEDSKFTAMYSCYIDGSKCFYLFNSLK